MNGQRYYSANAYFRALFGKKVYKLALHGGMTCPNRDGTCGSRGCIFCSAGGSGEFAEPPCGDVAEQLARAKARVAGKAGQDPRYIAYYQSYTNTYAPIGYLRELFCAALAPDDVVGLSVGTRPDCLPPEVLDLLGELNRRKPVFAELGLQCVRESTAAYIRRGYPLAVYDRAVAELRARGIHVVTHVIFGLPGETAEDMLDTVRHVASVGSDGIKIQLLQVLRGTDLETEYLAGRFETLSQDRYLDLVCDALTHLPPETVIHRLTGDPPKRLLVAPLWAADKKRVMNALAARLTARDIRQGSACRM